MGQFRVIRLVHYCVIVSLAWFYMARRFICSLAVSTVVLIWQWSQRLCKLVLFSSSFGLRQALEQ